MKANYLDVVDSAGMKYQMEWGMKENSEKIWCCYNNVITAVAETRGTTGVHAAKESVSLKEACWNFWSCQKAGGIPSLQFRILKSRCGSGLWRQENTCRLLSHYQLFYFIWTWLVKFHLRMVFVRLPLSLVHICCPGPAPAKCSQVLECLMEMISEGVLGGDGIGFSSGLREVLAHCQMSQQRDRALPWPCLKGTGERWTQVGECSLGGGSTLKNFWLDLCIISARAASASLDSAMVSLFSKVRSKNTVLYLYFTFMFL